MSFEVYIAVLIMGVILSLAFSAIGVYILWITAVWQGKYEDGSMSLSETYKRFKILLNKVKAKLK